MGCGSSICDVDKYPKSDIEINGNYFVFEDIVKTFLKTYF